MKGRNEIQKELKELKSRLLDIDHKNDFEVPENYFHDLSEKTKVSINKPNARIFSLNKKTISDFIKYAAVLLVFSSILVGILSRYMNKKDSENQVISETENYIIEEFESDLLIQYVVENDINSNADNTIEDMYLNDIDETLLIEEL